MNIKKYRRSYDRNLQLLNDSKKRLGNKNLMELNYHAGWDVGYIQGKLAVLETILDDEDPSIIDEVEDRVKAIQVLDAIDEARALHGTKPMLTHEELQALMPKAAPMQVVTEGFDPVAVKATAPKIWQQGDPAKSGSYICRMDSAFIKMCYFTGSTWLDIWKDSLDGSVKEWMHIPYNTIEHMPESGPGLLEILKMATPPSESPLQTVITEGCVQHQSLQELIVKSRLEGNPPPEAPSQTVITEGCDPSSYAPTESQVRVLQRGLPEKPPLRIVRDGFGPIILEPAPTERLIPKAYEDIYKHCFDKNTDKSPSGKVSLWDSFLSLFKSKKASDAS